MAGVGSLMVDWYGTVVIQEKQAGSIVSSIVVLLAFNLVVICSRRRCWGRGRSRGWGRSISQWETLWCPPGNVP